MSALTTELHLAPRENRDRMGERRELRETETDEGGERERERGGGGHAGRQGGGGGGWWEVCFTKLNSSLVVSFKKIFIESISL